MSSPRFALRKSTIVRFLILGAAIALGSGCGALPQRSATAAPCPPARTLVCDSFGTERRCACSDWSRVDRQLGPTGLPALGLNRW